MSSSGTNKRKDRPTDGESGDQEDDHHTEAESKDEKSQKKQRSQNSNEEHEIGNDLEEFGDDDDDDDDDDEGGDLHMDSDDNDDKPEHGPPIRTANITKQLNGGTYTFQLGLFKRMEGLIYDIQMKLYFTKEGAANVASKEQADNEVGYLTAFLIQRPPMQSRQEGFDFIEIASHANEEFAELAGMFCNRFGSLTKIETGLSNPKDRDEGGFLHIYSMEVMGPGHAGKYDLGLHLVHETLNFVKDDNWKIAVMAPIVLGVDVQKWPEYHNRLNIDPTALEHRQDQVEGLKAAHLKIKRHFARMGFRQAGRNSEHHHAWCITAPAYYSGTKPSQDVVKSWKSKEDVKSLDIFVAPDKHEPEGVDAELNALFAGEVINRDAIRDLVQKRNASIHRSRVLFAAASQNDTDILKLLVEELGGDVNKADENGHTPLHIAAMMLNYESIIYLINHGAKKDAVNDKGHRPLDSAKETVTADEEYGHTTDEDVDCSRRCIKALEIV